MYTINIYRVSTLVAQVKHCDFTVAFRAAVKVVKSATHFEGIEGGPGWYTTTNRAGFERGAYRATPEMAMRNR